MAVSSLITARRVNITRLKLHVNVGVASVTRILSLPADFFRDYSAGELNQYISYMDSLCGTIVDSVLSTGVTGVFSLVYLTQIFAFAPSLVWPSLIVTVVTLAVSMLSAAVQTQVNKERMVYNARESGLVYALINGIQKIRLAGAENRAFVKWSGLYVKGAELTCNPPAIIRLSSVITTAVPLTGTLVMYYVAVKSRVTVADYYAFNAAYAYISSAFSAVASVALSAAAIKPSMELLKPLLDAKLEQTEGQETVTRLSGSIFENIVISAPSLRLSEAWEAAEIAGIADDIRDMPMGMPTVLQEGGGTISGGQRQRLMIARAVAPKPKILMFDEATSALDNITQKKVSEALDDMRCTRIVIAHRLSTINHCDRILVLDNSRIAEDGTYDELIARKGLFADLVARQQIDMPA